MNKNIKRWLGLWRCIFADVMYVMSQAETKRKIDADVERYLHTSTFKCRYPNKKLLLLNYLLLSPWDKPFRNIFYYRFRVHPNLCKWSNKILPCLETIELDGDIASGLFLSHNFMVVHPKTAGKNLGIGPGVVIGKNGGEFPTIGNNVFIAANSTVIGDIIIEDNVIIGAGSVVTKNLKGNAVYAGNPVRFIKNIDNNKYLLGLINRCD